MTATHVTNRAVLADEPTASPVAGRDGSPIYWHQTRTLLLDDGSTTYGCAHCDYTSDNWRSIRPHLRVHNKHDSAPHHNGRADPALAELSLRDLSRRMAQLSEIEADRDRWRDRARRAEKALAALRRALAGVSE